MIRTTDTYIVLGVSMYTCHDQNLGEGSCGGERIITFSVVFTCRELMGGISACPCVLEGRRLRV